MYSRLILIYPPYSKVYSNTKYRPILPSFGLMSLATYIQNNTDVRAILIDYEVENLLRESDAEQLSVLGYHLQSIQTDDIIGFYTQTSLMPWIYKAVDYIKSQNIENRIIAGGPYATAVMQDALSNSAKKKLLSKFDKIFCGEAEEPLTAYLNNENCFSEKVIHQSRRLPESKYVSPDWELVRDYLPFYDAAPNWISGAVKSIPLLFSRGCIKNCKFCMCKLIWKNKFASKIFNNIKSEIEYVKRVMKVDHVQIWDDDVFLLPEYRDLLTLLSQKSLRYSVNSFITDMDEEKMKLLIDTGCTNVFFGIESADSFIQKKYGKSINLANVGQVVSELENNDIRVTLSFIIGSQYESYHSIYTLREFLKNSTASNHLINILSLHPGTRLYEELIETGFATEQSLLPENSFQDEPYSIPTICAYERHELQVIQKELTK